MAFVLDTSYGNAIPELQKLRKTIGDRADLHKVMAHAGTQVVQKHFAALAMTNRNKWGRPSTFWKRMRQATMPESSSKQAAVVMERDVALRRFGGTIKPTGGRRYLTIPVSKTAYGRVARSFKSGFVLKLKTGGLFIAQKSGKSGKLELLFALVKQATIRANRAILPADGVITAALKVAIAAWLKLKTLVK